MTNPFAIAIPADVDHLAEARVEVRRWLADEGLDPVTAGDLLAVASEFLLHAISRSGGAGTVHLVGERRAGGIRLAVRATPVGDEAPRRLRVPEDPLAQGAIGRRMVEECCDDVQIAPKGVATAAECWRGVA